MIDDGCHGRCCGVVSHDIHEEFGVVHEKATSREDVTVLRPDATDDESLVNGRNAVALENLKLKKNSTDNICEFILQKMRKVLQLLSQTSGHLGQTYSKLEYF